MAEAIPSAGSGTRGASGVWAGGAPTPGAVARPGAGPGTGPAPSVAPSPSAAAADSPPAAGSPRVAGRTPSVPACLALVAAGGCAGTLVRAALERAWPASPGHLPVTTLALNVVGALALGLLTTHSTFILESHRLLTSGGDGGHPVLGAAYLVGSMVAGLVAAGLGLWLAGRLRRTGRTGRTGSVGRAGRVDRAGSGRLPEAS